MRAPFLQIPPVLLALLLQLAPLVRWFSSPSLLAPQSAWAVVLKLSAGTAALLGAADAVSGASNTVIALATDPAPKGTNGVLYRLRMDLVGDHKNEGATWSASSLPAGLSLAPFGTARASCLVSGTPSRPGSNWVTVTAANTGNTSLRTTRSFAIVVESTSSPPAILLAPNSRRVVPGADTTFSVTAGGTEPLHYQWHLTGSPLPGETNTTLAVTNVAESSVGSYSVVITNSSGSITSQPALLVLAQKPTLAVASDPGALRLSFAGETGVVYRVESSADVGAATWNFVTNLTTTQDLPLSLTNSLSPTGSVFLRLKLQAP